MPTLFCLFLEDHTWVLLLELINRFSQTSPYVLKETQWPLLAPQFTYQALQFESTEHWVSLPTPWPWFWCLILLAVCLESSNYLCLLLLCHLAWVAQDQQIQPKEDKLFICLLSLLRQLYRFLLESLCLLQVLRLQLQ